MLFDREVGVVMSLASSVSVVDVVVRRDSRCRRQSVGVSVRLRRRPRRRLLFSMSSGRTWSGGEEEEEEEEEEEWKGGRGGGGGDDDNDDTLECNLATSVLLLVRTYRVSCLRL